jgi:hypothetical protein
LAVSICTIVTTKRLYFFCLICVLYRLFLMIEAVPLEPNAFRNTRVSP